jgi:hypothetical protein
MEEDDRRGNAMLSVLLPMGLTILLMAWNGFCLRVLLRHLGRAQRQKAPA